MHSRHEFSPFAEGVRSQPMVLQSPVASASLGQAANLSCSRSRSDTWSSNFAWYQQRAGQAPRFVHCAGCGSYRGEGIPDRFTASQSGIIGYLSITNVQDEDEADYYCAAVYSYGKMFHGGSVYGGSETKTSPCGGTESLL